MPQAARAHFEKVLAPQHILDSPQDLEFYGKDSCKDFGANAALILMPGTAAEVVSILKICSREGISIVPSGGRTGYSAGATATNREAILSLTRLNRILEVNPAEMTLTCEAGATTEAVRLKAEGSGFYYPVDFASRGSSHIGGNIATNAGGIRVIRYGNTRNWVLGLKVVTADGELLSFNGPLVKNQSGYDLRNLIIGSEGTLAVVIEATLKLTSAPGPAALALCALPNTAAALALLQELRQKHLTINVFEYIERNGVDLVIKHHAKREPFRERHQFFALVEIEYPDDTERERFEEVLNTLTSSGTISDCILAQGAAQSAELMSLRELISETIARHHTQHKNDISVPISSIPAYVAEMRKFFAQTFPEFELVIFGHIGDGNLHLNVLKPAALSAQDFFNQCHELDRQCFEIVQRYSGSISAEHGVGLLKRPYLHFTRSSADIALMRGIKRAFDPGNILNPGKVFEL